MGSIVTRKTATGETKYQAHVRRKGTPARVKTFGSLTKARSWIRRTEAAIEEHRDLPHREAMRTTFAELVERYTSDEGYSSLSDGEQRKRARQLEVWVQTLGDITVAELTTGRIKAARREIKARGAHGRPVASATVNRYCAALSRCLSYAVGEGLLATNPARSAMVQRGAEKKRDRVLTPGERERLLAACRDEDPELYLLAVLGLTTGGRQGELLRLTWADIDLSPGQERVSFLKTKNSRARSVPLPGPAIEALRETPQRIDGFLFSSRRFALQAWRRALRAAEIDDLRFHDLRHCFASTLAENGASLAELQSALGHLTPSMVARYAHLTERAVEDSLRRRMADRNITFV